MELFLNPRRQHLPSFGVDGGQLPGEVAAGLEAELSRETIGKDGERDGSERRTNFGAIGCPVADLLEILMGGETPHLHELAQRPAADADQPRESALPTVHT